MVYDSNPWLLQETLGTEDVVSNAVMMPSGKDFSSLIHTDLMVQWCSTVRGPRQQHDGIEAVIHMICYVHVRTCCTVYLLILNVIWHGNQCTPCLCLTYASLQPSRIYYYLQWPAGSAVIQLGIMLYMRLENCTFNFQLIELHY